MPKVVDEEKRRQRIAEAVWDIAAEQGLDRATVRAVAARCGLSVGSVQHSFRSQGELKRFAMELVVQRVTERLSATPDSAVGPLDEQQAVAALLLETLPLDDEREKEARIWAAFSASALVDKRLAPYGRQMSALLERFCLACLEALGAAVAPSAKRELRLEALHLHALLDGLTLDLLADPSPSRRQQAVQVVRSYVECIGSKEATCS